MVEELLKKIPPEMCWGITAKILTKFTLLRGEGAIAPLLGKGEGVISPLLGWEKWLEINDKIFGEGGRRMVPMVKETFNIHVEDAVGAAKLVYVFEKLLGGPEWEIEIVQTTPERAVVRTTKCPWWERQKEGKVDRTLMVCHAAHSAMAGEGLKAINPKITHKLKKSLPIGDPYCEEVIELKEK